MSRRSYIKRGKLRRQRTWLNPEWYQKYMLDYVHRFMSRAMRTKYKCDFRYDGPRLIEPGIAIDRIDIRPINQAVKATLTIEGQQYPIEGTITYN